MKINLRKFPFHIIILSFVIGFFGCSSNDQNIQKSKVDASISRQFTKYTVRHGDTIWKISQQFGTTPDTLVRINRIPDVRNLSTGKVLYIPSSAVIHKYDKSKPQNKKVPQYNKSKSQSKKVPQYNKRTPQNTNTAQFTVYTPQNKRIYNRPASPRGFIWPLRRRVLSSYGSYVNGSKSTGIDIEASSNDDVLAAKDGSVIVVNNGRDGWGKVVVIGHGNGTHTWYAHNSKIFVNKGTYVKRGQVIAKAGSTGSAKRVKLHFKVFVNDKPVNPLNYLPN